MKEIESDCGRAELLNLELNLVEEFTSIQGETSYAGKTTRFIRLGGCNLDCSYCDTTYSKDCKEFSAVRIGDIIGRCVASSVKTVLITGGEPLLQAASIPLMELLLEAGFTVLLETNGSLPIENVPDKVVKILDCKCPSSGESAKMRLENYKFLNSSDQVKFVLSGRDDYDYAKSVVLQDSIDQRVSEILLSPVCGRLEPAELARWMIEDSSPFRLNMQLHKIIWPKTERGV